MDAEYGARYRELYQRHWWWRAREDAICRLLESYAPEESFGAILDVGCGDGLFFEKLRHFGEPQGIETDAALVSDEHRDKIFIGPFDEHFAPTARFGLILMLDVVEHLDDDVAALRHARSLLAPGGLLIATVPAFRQLWTAHDDFNHHRTRYTRGVFTRSARAAGFEILSSRYFFHWLFPLKLAVRAKERLVATPPAIAEVPSPALNRLFYGLSRLEQATWGKVPWPFGSSLLTVCRSPSGVSGG